jgi:hypothetical protein
MRIRGVISAAGVAIFLLSYLLLMFFPVVPRTPLGWAALVGLGVPLWFFLEWLGQLVLGSSFYSRRSSAGRIVLAIPAVALLLAIGAVLIRLVQWAMVSS